MDEPDWITYVPRRVYDAATSLEDACKRCGCSSPLVIVENRMTYRQTLSARVLWH